MLTAMKLEPTALESKMTNKREVMVQIPLDALEKDYFVNFGALFTKSKPSLGLDEDEAIEEGASGDEDDEMVEGEEKEKKTKKTKAMMRKKRRKREEDEAYDLDDPFIDDTELPPGLSLIEMLAGVSELSPQEEEENKKGESTVPVVRAEFYVWKGKLPEQQIDPLWEEKVQQKKQRKRRAEGTTRKRAPRPNEEAEESKPKKTRKNTEELSEKVRKPKVMSVLERVVAMGSEDEPDVVIEEKELAKEPLLDKPVDSSGVASHQPETSEERMRKKLDINTPFTELESRLAMEAFKEEAGRTTFVDPKRFPSNLRPLCNEVIVCALRQNEKKTSLPSEIFEAMAGVLPFAQAALEKLVYAKIVHLWRDELKARIIPGLLEAFSAEIKSIYMESDLSKKRKWNDTTKDVFCDIVKCELDAQALDRLHKSQIGIKAESFSEISIRKSVYAKLVGCWPEGEMSTAELSKEYSQVRRREMQRKLKEHGIEVQPVLIPVKIKNTTTEDEGSGEREREKEQSVIPTEPHGNGHVVLPGISSLFSSFPNDQTVSMPLLSIETMVVAEKSAETSNSNGLVDILE
jgi:hypothetical protein